MKRSRIQFSGYCLRTVKIVPRVMPKSCINIAGSFIEISTLSRNKPRCYAQVIKAKNISGFKNDLMISISISFIWLLNGFIKSYFNIFHIGLTSFPLFLWGFYCAVSFFIVSSNNVILFFREKHIILYTRQTGFLSFIIC